MNESFRFGVRFLPKRNWLLPERARAWANEEKQYKRKLCMHMFNGHLQLLTRELGVQVAERLGYEGLRTPISSMNNN